MDVDSVAFLERYPINGPLLWPLRDQILQPCTQGPFPWQSTMGDTNTERSQSFSDGFTHSTDILNRHPCRHSGYCTMVCPLARVWTRLLVGHGTSVWRCLVVDHRPRVWRSLLVGHGPRVWRCLLVRHGPSVWGSLPVGHRPRVWRCLLFHPFYNSLKKTLLVVIGPQNFLYMRCLEISSVYNPICKVCLSSAYQCSYHCGLSVAWMTRFKI